MYFKNFLLAMKLMFCPLPMFVSLCVEIFLDATIMQQLGKEEKRFLF